MIRGRLAPSPTGALHLGNARTFLLAWLSLRRQRGRVVLRIEDLDGPRVKPESVRGVIEDLQWLGLDWDEGPDVGGAFGPYVQTQRLASYEQILARLRADQLVYPCVCTRSDIQRAASAPHPGEEGPRYPGTCRGRFASAEEAAAVSGRAPAWRFRVPLGTTEFVDGFHGPVTMNVDQQVGDFVVWKGSGTPAYQLAVVADDLAMEITEVVRGDDLLASTPRQQMLYTALGRSPPATWHVPLVVGQDGLRLAKRHGDTRIATFREQGISAERLVGLLAAWSGLRSVGSACRPRELVDDFDWSRVPHSRVVWDEKEDLRSNM